jgi:hypothetical protein
MPADSSTYDTRARSTSRLTLHLGVLVQPYRSKNRKAAALTTGDVAGFLEAKYGIMAAFYRVHDKDVAKSLESSLGGAMESLLMGKIIDPWGRANQSIQAQFRDFISSREVERVGIPGTPTKAALAGVNHRLKHPYRRANARRPSFRDTGMYMNSFRSWMT